MDYEIDRNPAEQPSLAEMTKKALDLLKDSEKGFFLMVEGSQIDVAGHLNDPAAQVSTFKISSDEDYSTTKQWHIWKL